jgi:flagellar hook-associated protein 2
MASVSSTSSLGNTSLRGFGGMVSGIDRDEIIEQMTLGTTTKITNAKNDITKLQWKQEAYRSLSDMIIGLSDNYGSFTSSSSLVDPTLFAKSIISVHGSDKSSKYVTATGTSDLISNIAISAVRQLATSTVQQSEKRNGELKTTLSDLDQTKFEISNLEGYSLKFGMHTAEDGWSNTTTFTFPSEVNKRDENGQIIINSETNEPEKVKISDFYYVQNENDCKKLVKYLNYALEDSECKIGENKLGDVIEFQYKDGKIQIEEKAGKSLGEYKINASSSALRGLGYTEGGTALTKDSFNDGVTKNFLEDGVGVSRISAIDGLTNATIAFNYNGSQKNVTMLTKEEAEELKKMDETVLSEDLRNEIAGYNLDTAKLKAEELGIDLKALAKKLYGTDETTGEPVQEAKLEDIQQAITDKHVAKKKMQYVADKLQGRLNQAFGKDNVTARLGEKGELLFEANEGTSSLSIVGGSGTTMWNLGVSYGASTRVNLNGTLSQDNLGIDLEDEAYKDGLVINGVKIEGITKDTSINNILSKINSSKAGVKATYVDATGQFMLVSSETGKGREINLDSELAKKLFGGSEDKGASKTDGQDAIIDVSYGNGVTVTMNRASNTFNLEGLNVTVSGVFGGDWKDDGTGKKVWEGHTADTVTFTAKADVDKVTERVKAYFEAFNELATEVNKQLTSRPDSAYGPLTEEQKAEMNETSIENWENKAKQGLLYGDTIIRDLSGDIQSVMVKLMNSGVNYQDLEKIGISYSEDYKDGGKLIFDESKFRAAMESDPEYVSNVFAGGGNVSKGLTKIVEDTLTPYATRYASRNKNGMGGSYGRLVEEAGSEKAPSTLSNNFIYKQIQEMQERITQLQSKLKTQQDRYIKQFSSMENLISQMNSQSSWLSQISG